MCQMEHSSYGRRHRDEDHDDHEEEDHDEHEENPGFLANSDFEAESMKFGVSSVSENGFIGFSYANIESSYGIPFHGEGHEGHGHEEHGDEDHDDHDEHEEEAMMNMRVKEFLQLSNQINLILRVLTVLMGSLLIC